MLRTAKQAGDEMFHCMAETFTGMLGSGLACDMCFIFGFKTGAQISFATEQNDNVLFVWKVWDVSGRNTE